MNCQKLLETFDWSSTPLGPRSGWPDGLISSVSICLFQPHPICVLWGKDQFQIYNDAFAKIIGDKHPATFGTSTRKTWAGEWEIRGKMIQTTFLEGKPLHIENYKISIPIDGVKQDRYFTFTASPIHTKARIEGVFATVLDQTDTILHEAHLRRFRMEQLKDLFLQAPLAFAILMGPEFIVEAANDAMLNLWGRTARKMTGKPVFDSIPEAREQGFEELLNKVLRTGERVVFDEIPFTVNRKLKIDNMMIKLIYAPLKESNGKTTGVLVLADEVTNHVNAPKREEAAEAIDDNSCHPK